MPVRAFLLLICIVVFLATTIARAEDCSCPAVQCDPCQKKLILGTEIKECTKGPAVACQKVVCENVYNYFQCIAGTPPLYIPPVDPATRYTEPRYTDPMGVTSRALNAYDKDEVPQASQFEVKSEPSPAPAIEKVVDDVSARDLASVEKNVLKTQEVPGPALILALKSGDVHYGKKSLHKSVSFKAPVEIKARKKSRLTLQFGKDLIHIEMEPNSSAQFLSQEGILMAKNLQGVVDFKIQSSRDLFVADLGDWRLGKKSGQFRVEHKGSITLVENSTEEAYLRREAIISKAERIIPNVELRFEVGADLYSQLDLKSRSTIRRYRLNEASQARSVAEVTEGRKPSGTAFCGSPEGQYEQCAWKCFGAAQNSKNCSSESSSAKCVRFTCSADGQWKLPTIVSDGECSTEKVHVGSCH